MGSEKPSLVSLTLRLVSDAGSFKIEREMEPFLGKPQTGRISCFVLAFLKEAREMTMWKLRFL